MNTKTKTNLKYDIFMIKITAMLIIIMMKTIMIIELMMK